jgi:glycosyltransferase involved in cell wall biosynthesis
MVMANKGDRKQYPLHFSAIRKFMDADPARKVQVYMHTEPTASMGGWDMRELAKRVGLSGKIYATNQYDTSIVPAPQEFMAQIYNACDVILNVSAGEGFGIPIVEAQACGVPVITGNYTSMPEITHYGYTIDAAGTGLGSHFGWQFMPNVDEIVYRLESVYRMDNKAQSIDAVEWARRNFDVPVIAAKWDAVIKRVMTETEQRVQSNRMEYA